MMYEAVDIYKQKHLQSTVIPWAVQEEKKQKGKFIIVKGQGKS